MSHKSDDEFLSSEDSQEFYEAFGEFLDDIEELDETNPIDSEDEAKAGPEKRDIEYTGLIKAYRRYYVKKSNANIKLRKNFFNCSFALIFN